MIWAQTYEASATSRSCSRPTKINFVLFHKRLIYENAFLLINRSVQTTATVDEGHRIGRSTKRSPYGDNKNKTDRSDGDNCPTDVSDRDGCTASKPSPKGPACIRAVGLKFYIMVVSRVLRQAAKDITRKLLKINKSKRLGKTAGGSGSVMKHKWFQGFDWEGLLQKRLDPPIDPKVRSNNDALLWACELPPNLALLLSCCLLRCRTPSPDRIFISSKHTFAVMGYVIA